jgi:hypothetical protein
MAMRPRMIVGVVARQWVMAIDGYHYTENTPTVAKDDPMLDAAPYWLYRMIREDQMNWTMRDRDDLLRLSGVLLVTEGE